MKQERESDWCEAKGCGACLKEGSQETSLNDS